MIEVTFVTEILAATVMKRNHVLGLLKKPKNGLTRFNMKIMSSRISFQSSTGIMVPTGTQN